MVLDEDNALVQKLENRIRKFTHKKLKASHDTKVLDDSTDEEDTFQTAFGAKS